MQQSVEITDAFIEKTIASGRAYCVVLMKAGPNRNQPPADVERIQQEHLRHNLRLRAEGKLLVHGPVTDDPELRGIGIYSSADEEEVKRLVSADPAVKAGRLVYEIHQWFGFPGDGLR